MTTATTEAVALAPAYLQPAHFLRRPFCAGPRCSASPSAHIRVAARAGREVAFIRHGLLGKEVEISRSQARALLSQGQALPLPRDPEQCAAALEHAEALLGRGLVREQAAVEAGLTHGMIGPDYLYFCDQVDRLAEAVRESQCRRPLRRLARAESGFTLIEVLVVILIMGILMTAGTNMMISLFNDFARTSQMTDRDSSAVAVLSYASSQLADAQTPIGALEDGDSRIEELSIAGDQLIFSANGACARVFYLASTRQLRAVQAASCSDPAITPERGPNQAPIADSNGDGFAEPGDPDFDPAIDSAGPNWLAQCGSQCGDGSFSVAENVVVGDDAIAGGGDPQAMSMFTYVENTGTSLAPVDAEAAEGSSNDWYRTAANAETILAVDVHACVALSSEGAGVRCFAPRTIYLGQVGA